MSSSSIDLLRNITETPGVSGFESPIRSALTSYLSPLAGRMQVDKLGSLIAQKPGSQTQPRIMLASHMDEVGLMVTQITKEGFLKFQPLGGWWEQVLLGQRVEILSAGGKIPGVIGAKAPHILQEEERKQPVKIGAMFIDVGSASKEETEEMGIIPGDPVVPFSPFTVCQNPRVVMAKALDDRAGCAVLVEVAQKLSAVDHPNQVYTAMTVQEEVGLRGANTSVDMIKPDVAIVVDVSVATDTPGIGENDVPVKTHLGKGPVVGFYDASMIPHLHLRDYVVKTCMDNGIPYQVDIMPGGGTDAGRIHISSRGVPSVVIGIPVRYIHSHVGLAHMDDYENAAKLITALVMGLNSETLTGLDYSI